MCKTASEKGLRGTVYGEEEGDTCGEATGESDGDATGFGPSVTHWRVDRSKVKVTSGVRARVLKVRRGQFASISLTSPTRMGVS
jgi:hypothetical protein